MQGKGQESDKPFYHHAYEAPSEEEERLGSLFHQLDVNGDGRIDVRDLSEALKRLSRPQVPGAAEVGGWVLSAQCWVIGGECSLNSLPLFYPRE